MKRLILNAIALLVIVAVGFLASRSYDAPKMTVPGTDIPAPELRELQIVDILFEPENARIVLALEIPENPTSGGIIADIMEIYRWSRGYYLPIRCGEDYPPELCKVGTTEIYLLSRAEIRVVGGVANVYMLEIAMGLDQIQMDKLLNGTPPETLQELFGFHQEVQQATQGTGGYVFTPVSPQMFSGIPR